MSRLTNGEKIDILAERLGVDFVAIEAEKDAAAERGAAIEAEAVERGDRPVEEVEEVDEASTDVETSYPGF